MSREQLRLENVELGSLIETANDALEQICKDVAMRPHKLTAREVNIKIKVKPEITDLPDRRINQPSIDWEVTTKAPGHKGMTTKAFVEGEQVLINTGDPLGVGHPNQTTIFDNEKGK